MSMIMNVMYVMYVWRHVLLIYDKYVQYMCYTCEMSPLMVFSVYTHVCKINDIGDASVIHASVLKELRAYNNNKKISNTISLAELKFDKSV